MKIFKLPDLGEGLKEAEIVEWHVKEGDVVKLHQDLVSMETAKAVVEVPSPYEGKVIKLFGKKGDIINTGSPLAEFASENSENSISSVSPEKSEPIRDTGTVAGELKTTDTVINETETYIHASSKDGRGAGIKVTPAIRALAQRLQVDLSTVTPTGPNGTINSNDINQAAEALQKAGPLELLRGVRRVMAETMEISHKEIVPVTVMEDAHLFHWKKGEDITVKIIQAMVKASKLEPALNAWYDAKAKGRRLHPHMNLGIAMDTADGLFVPVIKEIDLMDATAIRSRIETLKKEVQARTLAPEAFRGATITLSNFGKFAGRYANPIIVPPMVAILGAGRIREEPVVVEGQIRPTFVLPLALSFDHRAVTGGEATRFLGEVIRLLENPS